jgi:hypothetical protein
MKHAHIAFVPALIVGGVGMQPTDASASTLVTQHGSSCYQITSSNQVSPTGLYVNHWGVYNGTTTAADIICPLNVAQHTGDGAGIFAVRVGYWFESLASGQSNFSCTLYLTDDSGAVEYSNTQTSSGPTTASYQAFLWEPTVTYDNAFLKCTLPGYGTLGNYNYLSTYYVSHN